MDTPKVIWTDSNSKRIIGCDKHWMNGNVATNTKPNGCWNCNRRVHCDFTGKVYQHSDY